jgi:DNA anti-recombination protein RmuC
MAKQAGAEAGAGSLPLGLGNNAGELEVLRDLIFGNQARDFTRRLSDLDGRLEIVRRELKAEQDSRAQSVAKTAADQTTTLRKETNSRIDKEVRVLSERLEQLTADFYEHMEAMRRALETRLDRLQEDSGERMRLLEEDARRRDDDLRSELLTVSAWLEDKKTSREGLGRMLEEMGQRLQAAPPQAPTLQATLTTGIAPEQSRSPQS